MKSVLILGLLLLPAYIFAQKKSISVKDIHSYYDQIVTVHDSVISGNLVNDTTAIYLLRNKDPKKGLTVIQLIPKGTTFGVDFEKIVNSLKLGKLYITGSVFLIDKSPVIIVRDKKSFRLDLPNPE